MSRPKTWPPSASVDTEWRTVSVGSGQYREAVRVRRVRLWGEPVWIDENDRVLCAGCMELLTVAELSSAGAGHIPQAPGGRTSQPVTIGTAWAAAQRKSA